MVVDDVCGRRMKIDRLAESFRPLFVFLYWGGRRWDERDLDAVAGAEFSDRFVGDEVLTVEMGGD
jgi:hypothetical protein